VEATALHERLPMADSHLVERLQKGDVLAAVGALTLFLVALRVRAGIVFAVVVLAAVFVPMERVFALRRQRVFRRGWATDLVHFTVNNLLTIVLLLAAVVSAGTILRVLVPDGVRTAIAGQRPGRQFVEALLISSLC